MKRFLLPLLASIALPTAVNAAEVYLLVNTKRGEYKSQGVPSTFVVPMKTLGGCEEAGLKIIASDRFKIPHQSVRFECVESK